MKPVCLAIKGLRSYREEVEINFPQDGGLLAIVGDTGSGKSSILEAIFYALFNSPTWAGDDVKELIADDEPEMRVALTFEVDGVLWRVTRAHKQNTARSTHKLENVTDPGDPYDDARQVNARVEQILGFDRETFLSSVILPQGRFNRLLAATDKQRTEILSAVLRLGELDQVWQLSDRTLDHLEPAVRATVEARARLGNPEADAAAARSRLDRARKHRANLQAVADHRRDVLADADAILRRVTDLETHAEKVRVSLNGCAKRMEALAAVESSLSAERASQEDVRSESDHAAQTAAAELAAAAKAGTGLSDLAVADEALKFLIGEVARLAQLATDLDRHDQELTRERERLVTEERALEALRASEAATQTVRDAARNAVVAIDRRYAEARDALRAAAQAHKEAALTDAAVGSAKAKVLTLQDAAQRAAERAERAIAADAAAAAALRDAERADHAAACAHGLSAADPCPVCGTALPTGFSLPASGADLVGLGRAADSAGTQRRVAEAARIAADTAVKAANEAVHRAEEEAARRCNDASAAASVLHALLPDAHADAPEVVALARLLEDVRIAREAADSAARDHEVARDAQVRASADLAATRSSLDQRARRLAADRAENDRCVNVVEQRRQSLPDTYRPPVGADSKTMTAVHTRMVVRRSALAEVEAARDRHQELRRQAAERCDALAARQGIEVDRPSTEEWGIASALYACVAQAALLTGSSPLAPLDAAASVANRAAQVAALEQSAGEVLARIEAEVISAQAQIDEAEERVTAILRQAGITSAEALHQDIDQALKEVGAEERAEKNALARAAPALALAEVAGPFEERVCALREIKETMTSATFIAEVRRRREAHLLRAASQILLGLSGDRYAFAGQPQDQTRQHKQFVIYDHLTGQERPPQTLSGGETFLASLALALGLVEIAGRRDNRLEALFLDEGFGSLDDAALDEAVAALEKAATRGRLVTVVTHLRRVMDAIDHVLAVVRRPTGSEVHWVGPTERARAAEEDATAGLLV
jgi:DNA repair protein SbcC/Rad50